MRTAPAAPMDANYAPFEAWIDGLPVKLDDAGALSAKLCWCGTRQQSLAAIHAGGEAA